ncbi:MAG: hypothetical protein IT184_10355 [Acidobacteria bacterium]|nr:hypothetical protein [Acidobacteriota bacterium]
MIRLLAELLLLAYLPGAVLFRLPGRTQAARAALSWEERLFWAIVSSVAWSLAVVLALAFGGWYTFERLLAIDAGVVGLAVLGFNRRLRFAARPTPPGWSAVWPLLLVAAALWLYFPPSEYVIGGKDPGTYLNEGVQIAQRGALLVKDPMVSAVPEPLRDLFFPSHQQPWYYSIRFMGFFVDDPRTGTVVGQFPHLFPASIAIGYGLNGLSGARQAVGCWTMLGLLAVYFTLAHALGRRVAFGAAALTAINVMTVWFGRYPNSEVVLLALVFAAMLAFARAVDQGGVFFAAVAGALLGGLLFLRYDAVLAFVSFCAVALILRAVGQRIGLAFAAALAATAIPGYVYLRGPMQAYSAYPLIFTRDHGLLGLAAIAGLVLLARLAFRWEATRNAVRRTVPPGLALTFAALAIYAYFFRQQVGRLAEHDAMAFRSFGWYVGPWVLAAGVAGVAALTAARFWRAPVLITTIGAFSVFFFYKTRIVPEHFWAARRFLALILPGAMLGVAYVADRLSRWAAAWFRPGAIVHDDVGSWPPARPAVATAIFAVLVTFVGWHMWQQTSPVWRHVEYAGLIPRLERLASEIGDRDLLLVESRNAGSDLHVLATPLAYIYAKHVLVLDSVVPPRLPMYAFVDWASARYDRVLFLGGGGSDLLSDRLVATPLSGERFTVPEYASAWNAYPSGVRRKDFEYGLYRLSTSHGATAARVTIDVGGLDDLNVVRFYARERSDDGVPFRWTGAQSFVVVAGLAGAPHELTVWMSNGGRPGSAPPASVEVALDDVAVGTVTVTSDVRPYAFALPVTTRAPGDPPRLRLRVPTWNPHALLGVPDTRDLGVMVTRVEVR